MARDINLLPELTEEEIKTGVTRRKVNVFVTATLLLVIAIIACFFGYWLFLASSAERVRSQTKGAEDTLKKPNYQRKEITRRALVAKLDEAQKFLSSAVPFSISFDKLTGILKDSGAVLTDSKFKNDGRLTVTGEIPTSDSLSKFINGVTAEVLSDTFGQVTLNSLSFDEKNNFYTFTIDMRYLKKGFPEAVVSGGLKKP